MKRFGLFYYRVHIAGNYIKFTKLNITFTIKASDPSIDNCLTSSITRS